MPPLPHLFIISGWCASSQNTHDMVLAVVSEPANSRVCSSMRTWRSLIMVASCKHGAYRGVSGCFLRIGETKPKGEDVIQRGAGEAAAAMARGQWCA